MASLPKHARLRAALVGAVQAGELSVGARMAGERELSESLGLSLGTTQKALGKPVDEGFLVRRQGHGTFVGTLEADFAAPTLHSDGMANVVTCLPADARLLKLAQGTLGRRVRIRTYSLGHKPITWQRMFVPPTEHGLKLDFNPPST